MDWWALGCIIYELLQGELAFGSNPCKLEVYRCAAAWKGKRIPSKEWEGRVGREDEGMERLRCHACLRAEVCCHVRGGEGMKRLRRQCASSTGACT